MNKPQSTKVDGHLTN